jgi:hypothetical protein
MFSSSSPGTPWSFHGTSPSAASHRINLDFSSLDGGDILESFLLTTLKGA